jgi:hypothetical protein
MVVIVNTANGPIGRMERVELRRARRLYDLGPPGHGPVGCLLAVKGSAARQPAGGCDHEEEAVRCDRPSSWSSARPADARIRSGREVR